MAWTGKNLREVWPIIEKLPDGIFFNVIDGGPLEFQSKRVMEHLPGVVWRKQFNETCMWWEYRGECEGHDIRIYADREGPQSCLKVEYEVEEDVQVPVEFKTERRMVKKTRWECPDGSFPGGPGDTHA